MISDVNDGLCSRQENILVIEVAKMVDPRSELSVKDSSGQVIWIGWDDFASQYGVSPAKDMEGFYKNFPTPMSLIQLVLAHEEFEDIGFPIDENTIDMDRASSIEVHGYLPDGEVFFYPPVDS